MNQEQLKQFIVSFQKGDQTAFVQIYNFYYDKIFSYAFRRTLHHESAEDIVANTFLKVFSNLKKFAWKHGGSFNGWIYKIASNEVLMYFRKEKKYRSQVKLPENFENIYGDEGNAVQETERKLLNDQNFRVLRNAISKLTTNSQEILHLSYFENLNSHEIADALSMKESTVRVSLHRSMKQLETILKDQALEYTERTNHE